MVIDYQQSPSVPPRISWPEHRRSLTAPGPSIRPLRRDRDVAGKILLTDPTDVTAAVQVTVVGRLSEAQYAQVLGQSRGARC